MLFERYKKTSKALIDRAEKRIDGVLAKKRQYIFKVENSDIDERPPKRIQTKKPNEEPRSAHRLDWFTLLRLMSNLDKFWTISAQPSNELYKNKIW